MGVRLNGAGVAKKERLASRADRGGITPFPLIPRGRRVWAEYLFCKNLRLSNERRPIVTLAGCHLPSASLSASEPLTTPAVIPYA